MFFLQLLDKLKFLRETIFVCAHKIATLLLWFNELTFELVFDRFKIEIEFAGKKVHEQQMQTFELFIISG